jgi:hypothetical protein
MLFFPSVTFGAIAAEIFPWALLYMLSQSRRAWRWALWAAVAAGLWLICAGLFHATPLPGLGQSARSLAAYLNGLMLFAWLMRAPGAEIAQITRLIGPVFMGLLALGLLQISGALAVLEPLFTALVPRASATALVEMGRGVTLVSSEPSRAGFEMVLLYGALRLMRPRMGWVHDLAFLLFLVLCIQAISTLVLAGLFLAVLWGWRALLALPLLALLWGLIALDQSRIQSLIDDLILAQNLSDRFDLILQRSGFRITSLWGAGLYGLSHPFGGGVGNWPISMLEALGQTGLDPATLPYFASRFEGEFAPVRPTSVAGNLLLDLGVVGFVGVTVLLGKIIARSTPARRIRPMLILVGFIYLAFGGAGHPLPWLVLAVCLRGGRIEETA